MSGTGKKILRMAWCTRRGEVLAEKVSRELSRHTPYVICFRKPQESLTEWAKGGFELHQPLVFIGALGIAVRTIVPLAADKLTDSPVLVLDETGCYVIPVLSGHMGGANALAREIAQILDLTPVITTATDANGLFSIDDFARRNGLRIGNREGIRKVSSKVLSGQRIGLRKDAPLQFSGEKPESVILLDEIGTTQADAVITQNPEIETEEGIPLYLIPKNLVLGIGCRRGVPFERLKEFVFQTLADNGLEQLDVRGIASIDRKAEELGLMMLAQYLGVPFFVYTAEELRNISDENFHDSPFVQKNMGVGNVCERAASIASDGGQQLLPKTKGEGMTLSIYRQNQWHLKW